MKLCDKCMKAEDEYSLCYDCSRMVKRHCPSKASNKICQRESGKYKTCLECWKDNGD